MQRQTEGYGGPRAMLERDGEMTIASVAKKVGRSPDTIRRWIRAGKIHPRYVQCGEVSVAVWNDDEVKALKKFAGEVKRGRPPVGLKRMK